MWTIRKKLKPVKLHTGEIVMSADKPPMQTTPLVKTLSVPIEVPMDFEMAGAVLLVFDKKLERPVLDFPYHNLPLSLHCLNIISNTILGHAVGTVHQMQGGELGTKSHLILPSRMFNVH